ncbi:MAG: triose-phosphate isomerase [Candidatus Aminicenantes bacterium]|nr:triose-phosphate isomerase [Candidatus Aminicenantes bacterium]
MNLFNKKPFIAGNWKLHKNISESIQLAKSIKQGTNKKEGAEIVIIPPYVSLSEVKKTLLKSNILLGAQNVFWEESGAYTGEISPSMIKDAGCDFVIVGHSERRQYFGDTDERVNKKVKAVLSAGLHPIVCIGETLEERENNKTMDKVRAQITKGLKGINQDQISDVIIAYEPIWAIGTGRTATPKQAEKVHEFIRNQLEEMVGKDTSSCAIILYGGSVKPKNAFSLIKEKNINGALIGGASLEADSFVEIIEEAKKAYKEK